MTDAASPAAPKRRKPVILSSPAVETVAPAVSPAIEEPVVDEIKNAAETVQQNAQNAFAKVSDDAKGAFAKGKVALEDASSFAKGNVEALVESTRIAAKGFEAIAQQRAAFAKQSFDQSAAAMKSLASATSPTEFFRIQGDYLRSAVDALVAETSRATEEHLKLVGEIAQPIQNRVALAADKVKAAG